MPSILNHGLPALGPRGASTSESGGKQAKHGPATGTIKPLAILTEGLVAAESMIWMEADMGMLWASGDDIKGYVGNVLKDTLRTLQFHRVLRVQAELYMFGTQKADFYYLRRKTAPIGLIEVKKPNGTPFDGQPSILGQIYDYLLALKQFQGLEHVYGILTSYKEWRVCWLSDRRQPRQHVYNHSRLRLFKESIQHVGFLTSRPSLGFCSTRSYAHQGRRELHTPQTQSGVILH
ncbi:uncharacterized protein EV422DRAFT_541899 [Fimicolochytrium jonesii]|uniref:uncharacterized protein n=1 Tax=Fimicolochytrium jonesii TaxID=1396493 RepID=UPI0022FE28BC|nr:uncharacterized protein EV422DRAFT_541899 [Fimicolochytrium jonesii]KAI8817477.1 hypothetical protein EV422DRAFT_541899 [Fimicolochytrium jonesii]